MVKIFSSMMAAMGKQLKQSVNVFHNLILYRRLPNKEFINKRRLKRGGEAERGGIARTFVIKAVNSIYTCTLVVAPKDEEVLRIFDLVCQKQANSLKRLLASVYVVAKEKVIGLWWEAAILEKAEQIVVLPVNVTFWRWER